MKETANGMPFINDEKATGKWDFIDIVSSQDEFNPIRVMNSTFNKGFKEIYFLPEGKKYWILVLYSSFFIIQYSSFICSDFCNEE